MLYLHRYTLLKKIGYISKELGIFVLCSIMMFHMVFTPSCQYECVINFSFAGNREEGTPTTLEMLQEFEEGYYSKG